MAEATLVKTEGDGLAVFLAGGRAALAEMLRRGIERDHPRPELDLELALGVLGRPFFYRLADPDWTRGPRRDRVRRVVAVGAVALVSVAAANDSLEEEHPA